MTTLKWLSVLSAHDRRLDIQGYTLKKLYFFGNEEKEGHLLPSNQASHRVSPWDTQSLHGTPKACQPKQKAWSSV